MTHVSSKGYSFSRILIKPIILYLVLMETKIEKPIVKHTIRDVSIVRSGRGYSISELKQCGLDNIKFARNRGIIIDKLRKTAYPENIQRLKILVDAIMESERKKKNDIRKDNVATRKRQKTQSTGSTSTKKTRKAPAIVNHDNNIKERNRA